MVSRAVCCSGAAVTKSAPNSSPAALVHPREAAQELLALGLVGVLEHRVDEAVHEAPPWRPGVSVCGNDRPRSARRPSRSGGRSATFGVQSAAAAAGAAAERGRGSGRARRGVSAQAGAVAAPSPPSDSVRRTSRRLTTPCVIVSSCVLQSQLAQAPRAGSPSIRRRSCSPGTPGPSTPILLLQKPEAVRSRKELKNEVRGAA